MKKLFIAVPLMGMFLFNSCKKETEIIIETETVSVTDTLSVSISNSIAVYMEPFDQLDFGNGDFGMAELNYSVQNIGEQDIDFLEVVFEAETVDGSKYVRTDYHTNLNINDDVSSQLYIITADKECKNIKVKEIEITVY
jgi:hypothetical protein